MGFFSRRTRSESESGGEPLALRTDDDAPVVEGQPPLEPDEGAGGHAHPSPSEPVPHVGISLSTFRGGSGEVGPPTSIPEPGPSPDAGPSAAPGTSPDADPNAARPGRSPSPAAVHTPRPGRPAGPAEAPPPSESVPGIRDNVLLTQALGRLDATATSEQLLDVMRQFLQNHVFLRIKGDARARVGEGRELPLAVARRGDETYVLVYSSGPALQAALSSDGQIDTSAVGQPALTVLKHVLAGPYAGMIIDGASAPARAVIPRAVIEAAVNQADPALRIKSALAAPRTTDTAGVVAAALTEAPLFVAVNETGVSGVGEPRLGIAETRTADGRRTIEIYSHPLEVLARGRGDRPMPFPPAQLGAYLRDQPAVAGVIVDAAGPWIELDRDALAQVMALPAPAPSTNA